MGGQAETISGLSGIGDLMLTAFGALSRNRACGVRLMESETLAEICQGGNTVEGVPTAQVAVAFAREVGLELPIFNAVNDMLLGKITCEEVQMVLMNRPLQHEYP